MTNALEIRGLTKVYGNGFEALKGIDLSVKSGDFFALLGPNGAGKSTTLGIVSALVNKTAGSVHVCGIDQDAAPEEVKKKLGVVPQEFNFNTFEKVWDILMQQAGYYGMPRALAKKNVEKYLRQLELWDKRDVQGRMLSGGMKRRLMIARALIHEPELLILDEPTAGVDIEIRRTMWEFLRRINAEGTTIILTTHYLEEAESLCRNIAIINRGEIIANTTVKDLLRQMNKASFVAELGSTLNGVELPDQFGLMQTDDHTLEFQILRSESLNQVFALFEQAGIQVNSVRPKTNRLEELFVDIVQGDAL
ncbi:ABC transporter ATP-binding protein [Salinispirillum sp. LH 10-3-1]|uniref:ABC transporter ATP-binding protein n=1 Tax=Salinispirillum sp. LH 10-3-1 TaxID=2952525 RepID=A0AB38YJ48_9GAMM